MIIHEVVSALEKAVNPVVKVLQKSEHVKVIVLGFKKGMSLKEHKTNVTTKLVVIQGSIVYKRDTSSVVLDRYDDIDIPIDEPHAVEALDDSICFLIQG